LFDWGTSVAVRNPNRKLPFFLSAILALFVVKASAAVSPLSFGPAGVGPLTFDTLPTLSNGWSTLSVAGANSYIQTSSQLDTAVNTNDSFNIASPLTNSATVNPPGVNAFFRWNSVNHYIQSRPTGNAYSLLLLTLRNDSVDQSLIAIDYDFGAEFAPGTTEGEDVGLEGHRVYYSLTGAPDSWIHIPELDGGLASVGPKYVDISLPLPWETGAPLYILWADDNGVTGSTSTNGPAEGAYTIDNLFVHHSDNFQPVSITHQPITPPTSARRRRFRILRIGITSTTSSAR